MKPRTKRAWVEALRHCHTRVEIALRLGVNPETVTTVCRRHDHLVETAHHHWKLRIEKARRKLCEDLPKLHVLACRKRVEHLEYLYDSYCLKTHRRMVERLNKKRRRFACHS